MDRIEIVKDSDFPVTAKTFRFMQDAYKSAIQHLCKMYGDNIILYGCELVSGNRTAGAVVINGELLPFEASPDNANITIAENAEPVIYKGGELLPAYYTRTAKCSATGTIALASLRRVIAKTAAPTNWVNCTPTGDIQVTQTIQVRINENGRVQLRGKYRHVNDWVYGRDFDIPAAFIPAFHRLTFLRHSEGAGSASCPLGITKEGYCQSIGIAALVEYELDCEYEL